MKRWLSSGSAERSTVFLLGFGLNMTDQEVSMFLMKVLKEHDFDFSDPVETVYWHCFHHGLHYADAAEMLSMAKRDAQSPVSCLDEKTSPETRFWDMVKPQLTVYLSNPSMLMKYLKNMQPMQETRQRAVSDAFRRLYDPAVEAARKLLGRDERTEGETSGAYDIESVLYSGVPRSKDRNLLPSDRSVLAKQFGRKRLGRQRLGKLIAGEIRAERFDLLTLLFLEYALSAFPETPEGCRGRFEKYIDEANSILKACGMWEVYPVNPYESFLLMCLLSEDPLCTFNDVWESSYEQ